MISTGASTTVKYGILAVLALAAVFVAVLAFAGPALSAEPAKTTLTIRAQGLDLSGTVRSERSRCLGNRQIKLYKVKPGADELVATDTSERQGNRGVWSTGNTGMSGRFYVRTGKVPGCKGAVSKTIRASN